MRKTFALTLVAATLLGGVAVAQTTPGSENTTNLAPKAHHHRHTPKPATPSTSPNANTSATSANNATTSSRPASAPSSSQSNSTPATAATPPNPDQGKPGVTPQDNSTTNMHTPGSENPADTGPGTPKN